jgi:hypothetical protein
VPDIEQPTDGRIVGLLCTVHDGCTNDATAMGVDSSAPALDRSGGTGEQVWACREHTGELLDRGVMPVRIGPPEDAEPVLVQGGGGAGGGQAKRGRT